MHQGKLRSASREEVVQLQGLRAEPRLESRGLLFGGWAEIRSEGNSHLEMGQPHVFTALFMGCLITWSEAGVKQTEQAGSTTARVLSDWFLLSHPQLA